MQYDNFLVSLREALIILLIVGLGLLVPQFSVQRAGAFWLWPTTYDECVTKYVNNAAPGRAARGAAMACAYKFKDKKNIGWANCILDGVLDAKNDIAASLLARRCSEEHGSPK
jgi:hypothetical protein